MGFSLKSVKKSVKKTVNKASAAAGKAVSDVTGSESLGAIVEGGGNIAGGTFTADVSTVGQGVGQQVQGATGLVGELSGRGEAASPGPTADQKAASDEAKEIEKKKKELEGALFTNNTGVRQQSVLNPVR